MAFELKSTAFDQNGAIPKKYTCDGEDVSPPLTWTGIPAGTKSLVLIMDDPDAPMGTWDHWILFNLPPNTTELPENSGKSSPSGSKGGKNSWGKNVWGGPCPPDKEHRYFFKLYAVDQMLNLPEGATKKEVLNAVQGHTKEQAELMGRYDRPR